MTTKEKQFTPEESLQLIQEMILTAKSSLQGNSFYFLLWGWLAFTAAITHFILLTLTDYQRPWLPWPILMTIGGISAAIYGYRSSKTETVKNQINTFMGYLWGGFMISLLIVLAFMFKIGPEVAYPVIIIFYGLGAFVSGGMLRFRPLIWGGVSCWLLAAISFMIPFEYQLITTAMALLFSYIIPGHILTAKDTHV